MKVHILLNALDYGDAVSTHCILLKERCQELGIPARLYAEFSEPRVSQHVTPLADLLKDATADDVLLHQFFNETSLIRHVENFPGRRVMMYLDITPPEFFPVGSPAHLSCSRGLRQAQSLTALYDVALGISEFSRLSLEAMGYPNTGVFPVLMDLQGLRSLDAKASELPLTRSAATTFLFVGRIAPNKKIDDLLRFLAAYRASQCDAVLWLVGNDAQHTEYKEELLRLARSLSLEIGKDVILTGKIPGKELAARFRLADAYICMSEHEGFCVPLIESMAFELPTFAYAAGAVEGTLGGAGGLFRDKNFNEVARFVAGVLGTPALREDFVRRQQLRVKDFDAERQRENLRTLLENLSPLSSRSRAAGAAKVSVVINTYNRSWRLKRCLDSLESQTYPHFEVIVVNGPSTDDTAAVLSQYGDSICVVDTPDRVLSVSRNEGIARACGQLVAFVDDDAICHPKWLDELVRAFDDEAVGGAGGLVYRMNGSDVEFQNGIIDRRGVVRWNEPDPGLHWNWEDGYLNTVSGNNCMFRRSALTAIGGFDEAIEYYHDEADVVMRLSAAGFRIVHRPSAVVYHESATGHNRRNRYWLNWYAVLKNTLYCALKNLPPQQGRLQTASAIINILFRERMWRMLHWRRAGQISWGELFTMEAACVRGILAGLRKGLFPKPRLRRFADPGRDYRQYTRETCGGFSVCLLTQDLPLESPGGIATCISSLAFGLRDLGCVVHLISRGEPREAELRDGIWYHTASPSPIANELGVAPDLHATARNLDYSQGVRLKVLDIAARWGLDMVESPTWDVEGLLLTMDRRFPVVVRLYSPLHKVRETQNWPETADLALASDLEGLLLRFAAGVVGSTEAVIESFDARFGLLRDQTVKIPLGLSLSESCSPGSDGAQRVLFVGRLELRKGIQTLLAAIPDVLRACPGGVEFDIVGQDVGDPPAGIDSWARFWSQRHGGDESTVRFHGRVDADQLSKFYEDCDVFVAPSLYESFGLIYLEAMARTKPVIGSNAGGIPEVVVNGETGLLIPPGDVGALSAAIIRLVRDRQYARSLGEAGYRRYKSCFSQRALADATLRFYHDRLAVWRKTAADVWRASAMDYRLHPATKIVWAPQARRAVAVAEAGEARVVVYGPYISLPAGSYRAEFTLFLDDVPEVGTNIGHVDVVSIGSALSFEKRVVGEHFGNSRGSIVDVFFSLTDPVPPDLEFRVHTAGSVALNFVGAAVREWPPREPFPVDEASSRTWPAREHTALAPANLEVASALASGGSSDR